MTLTNDSLHYLRFKVPKFRHNMLKNSLFTSLSCSWTKIFVTHQLRWDPSMVVGMNVFRLVTIQCVEFINCPVGFVMSWSEPSVEAKQISVSWNHISIRFSGIIAVGAYFGSMQKIELDGSWGEELLERQQYMDYYHCIILFGHLLSIKPYFFTSSITMTQNNCSS